VDVVKKVLYLSFFIILYQFFPLFSESKDLDSVLDLAISLKELSQFDPEKLDEIILSDKYILLEGSVSSITEIERTDTNLILDIHLINGEWNGLEKVQVFKCIVNISGIEWEHIFPARTPRESLNDIVLLNNRIIVIGKVTDYVLENSSLLAIVEAQYIRNIQ
jgi:hypothetical protein